MSEFESTLRAVLAAGHAARFRAAGDSMYPAIRNGDLLEIVRCEASELRRGDVVLAATGRGLTAHRIVRIGEHDGAPRITTRGDNALRCDPPIAPDDILGRVVQASAAAVRSATITRFAAVLVRRLRSKLQR
ncbi:MAG: S24/S26 family peptidase [Thermoanaerobaculia bacterium]